MQYEILEVVAPNKWAMLATSGYDAHTAIIEFLTARIRNQNTRRAYAQAIGNFMQWCDRADVHSFQSVRPIHIASWVEWLTTKYAPATVKQHLAAVGTLLDWLTVKQIIPSSPAVSVRGPRETVGKGKTPVLHPEEARLLLDSINVGCIKGLRDRALIALMLYSFARVGAVLGMKVSDVFFQHRRMWVRLHEKRGKLHDMPCHHELEFWLSDYLAVASKEHALPLFRSLTRHHQLSDRPLLQPNVLSMVQTRARAAGIATEICNHTFRATGITAYLSNNGTLENAARMANHSSTQTTQLYDRRNDGVMLSEVERIRF